MNPTINRTRKRRWFHLGMGLLFLGTVATQKMDFPQIADNTVNLISGQPSTSAFAAKVREATPTASVTVVEGMNDGGIVLLLLFMAIFMSGAQVEGERGDLAELTGQLTLLMITILVFSFWPQLVLWAFT